LQNDLEKESDREDQSFKEQDPDEGVFHQRAEKRSQDLEVDPS